jgi:hypothetical protein
MEEAEMEVHPEKADDDHIRHRTVHEHIVDPLVRDLHRCGAGVHDVPE